MLYTGNEVQNGGFIFADTGSVLHHDLIGSAAGIDKLIGAGRTVNEVQKALGQPASDDPLCDQRFITRNYQTIESATAEGGEENA